MECVSVTWPSLRSLMPSKVVLRMVSVNLVNVWATCHLRIEGWLTVAKRGSKGRHSSQAALCRGGITLQHSLGVSCCMIVICIPKLEAL